MASIRGQHSSGKAQILKSRNSNLKNLKTRPYGDILSLTKLWINLMKKHIGQAITH